MFKIIKQDEFFGVISIIDEKIIIPCEYSVIQIHLDKYFDVMNKNGRKIVNESNQILYDLGKTGLFNYFDNQFGIFKIICVEIKNNMLTYYGRNVSNIARKNIEICSIIFKGNQVVTKTMQESELDSKLLHMF